MTVIDAAPSPSSVPEFDDELWELLLELIARDLVVPIIGPALSVVEVDGRRITVDRYVAEHLAGRLGLDTDQLPPNYGLDAVVAEQVRRGGPSYLHTKVNAILREAQFQPPSALVKLAGIQNFRLFITTAYDTLMEAAVDKVRGGGARACESVGYSPSDATFRDFESSGQPGSLTTVYHLLGRASALPEFVISEEDLLEYMVALQSERKRPAKLFDELGTHHLLILGGNFPDWLFRMFLRLAKRRRLSERSAADREILADDRSHTDRTLVSFLSSFSPSTIVAPGGAEAFVDELCRRWSAAYGGAVPRASEGRVIFLSYSHRDAAAAQVLNDALRAQGFQVWFDKAELEAGDNWEYKIREALKSCALFMPLISRNTEAEVAQVYFRLEWNLADQLSLRNAASVRFIVPVVIDSTPRGEIRETPPSFMSAHALYADGGAPTGQLIAALKSELEARR